MALVCIPHPIKEQIMKKIIFAVCLALGLVACGGGGSGEAFSSAAVAVDAFAAKPGSPDPTLVAQPASMVNTTTAGAQFIQTVDPLADGGYAVGWVNQVQDPNFSDPVVRSVVQKYDSSGAKVGAEVTVVPTGSMAVLSDGSFVVATSAGQLVSGSALRMAVSFSLFDANGVSLLNTLVAAGDITSNPARPSFVRDPEVVALAGGGFVVGWVRIAFTSVGILNQVWTQRYDDQGQPVGTPTLVISVNAPSELFVFFDLEPDGQGGYTVKVTQPRQVAPFSPLMSYFHVDANGALVQLVDRADNVLLLALEGGRYVLFTHLAAEASTTRQFLDSAGNPVGSAVPVTFMPVAAEELVDGSFVVFTALAQTTSAQRFDSTGKPIGNELTLSAGGSVPLVAALSEGGFAAGFGGGTFSEPDVFTQMFIEVLSPDQRAKRRACLAGAKGMTGQERKAFMDACMQ
jgi:hypothetical protein